MPPIEVYTTPYCSYCSAAKNLLRRKGATFSEIDVSMDPGRMTEMVERANGRMTVPQIFIGATHVGRQYRIGGCPDRGSEERRRRLCADAGDDQHPGNETGQSVRGDCRRGG